MVNVELPDSWEKVNLGNALSYIGNGLTDKQNKVNDGYPVTRIETISDDCIDADKVGYISALPEDKIEKYRLCYGDMLVSHINSDPQLGRSVVYEGNPDFLLHGMNLLRMRANTKVLTPFFLNLIFRFYRNRGVFIALASRAVGQSSINQSRMKSLIIPLPPLPEQRAIAHVLQTIQEANAARQRELTLERERKAALMDYLFSYGTKDEPRKQTEIGEIPESWEVTRLGDLVKLKSGLSRPNDMENEPNSELNVPVYGGNGVLGYTGKEFSEQRLLVIGRVGAYCGCVHIAEVPNWITDNALYSEKWFNSGISLDFLAEQLKHFNLNRLQRKGGQPLITQSIIHELKIPLPPLLEQHVIAETSQVFDIKIAALEQEAERLDELFHAMLHELMTGQRSAVPLIDLELLN